MNCLDSHALLQRYLDGEPLDRAALEVHLASCPTCAVLHRAAKQLQAGLRLQRAVEPPAGLAARIVMKTLADRRARRRRWLTAAAMAASLLLAAAAGYWLRSPRAQPLPDVPAPIAESPPSFRDSMTEAGSAVVRLTQRKADETVEQTRRLWPGLTPPSLDDPHTLTEPLEPPARSLREASQGVSSGLEPVASSARRAVGMFLREIPPMGVEDKPGF